MEIKECVQRVLELAEVQEAELTGDESFLLSSLL